MTDAGKGVLAMLGVCLSWGFSTIFYKALAHVPPLEVLAHRTLWSVVFLALVLGLQGRLREPLAILRSARTAGALVLAAALIATNWFFFVVAVQTGETLQASLGYYVFPLVAVGLGFAVLGERFSRLQVAAIALAALAVATLTFGLGTVPWISLILAVTFGFYGLLKNRIALGPVTSVLAEAALLLPVALVWLVLLHSSLATDPSGRAGGWFGADALTTVLLILSGVLTGGPLILFSYAARRVAYATLGLIGYLNPTIQFLVAVLVFGETFTRWHGIAFPLIWAALALYSLEAWRRERTARQVLRSAA